MDLADATFARIAAMSLDNAAVNRDKITQSVAELRWPRGADVIIAANGPSAADSLAQIADSSWSGKVIIVVDSVVAACRRAGFAPDLVVSCDPHPRIAHWFGAEPDDHLRRTGEVVAPSDLRGLPVALATASHPHTVEQCQKAGMRLYWWNAMLDDPSQPGWTRALYNANGLPCLNGGGNVGTAAWVLAHQVLKAKTVALVGFDFGYPPGFPLERTQYAPELQELYGDRWTEAFTTYPNGWFADPAMAWFREVFMEMVKAAPCRTVNCTEGGTLDGIERMPLAEFLR